jgi:abequosyltransferase
MATLKISFCIPTYNRCHYLKQAIVSILAESHKHPEHTFEICISDNASTDDTPEMIRCLQAKSGSVDIIYSRVDANAGPDRNYLRAVSLASGDYCWLFGSDDTLPESSLELVLPALLGGVDICLVNRRNCDKKMRPLNAGYWLNQQKDDRIYDTASDNELLIYLSQACSLGALFSYLSSIVVSRVRWNSIDFDNRFIGTAYSHAFILLRIIEQGARLQYLVGALVNSRGGNDSFATGGLLRRYLLDYEGYLALADTIFSNAPERREAILTVLRREHQGWRLYKIRALAQHAKQWSNVHDLMRRCGHSEAELTRTNWAGLLALPVLKVFQLSECIRRRRNQ